MYIIYIYKLYLIKINEYIKKIIQHNFMGIINTIFKVNIFFLLILNLIITCIILITKIINTITYLYELISLFK